MEFRQAVAEDAPAIERLYRLLVPGDTHIRVEAARIAQIGADARNFLFVLDEGASGVLATALVTLCLDPMYGEAPFAVMENIVVDPAHRGRGAGTFLLAAVEAFCWQQSCSKLMLSSAAWRGDAHRFFERLGFAGRTKLAFVKFRSDAQ